MTRPDQPTPSQPPRPTHGLARAERWSWHVACIALSGWLVLLLVHFFAPLGWGIEGTGLSRPTGLLAFVASVLVFHASLVSAMLLPVALWRRKSIPALLSAVVAAVGLWPCLALPFTRPPATADPHASITVMAANINFENRDIDAIVEGVNAVGPDVLLLQELTLAQEQALSPRLIERFPFRFIVVRKNNRGQAIYSRFPLTDPHELPLSTGRWNAPALVASIAPPGLSPVLVVNVHLPAPVPFDHAAESVEAARTLAAFAHGLQGPLIIAGDHNQPPTTSQYHHIRSAGLREACEQVQPHNSGWAGRAATRPDPALYAGLMPSIRIDHVWTNAHARVIATAVGQSICSDHLPISATVLIESSARLADRP